MAHVESSEGIAKSDFGKFLVYVFHELNDVKEEQWITHQVKPLLLQPIHDYFKCLERHGV